MPDNNSILTQTKKYLGFDENYEAFDTDIIMHINASISTLNQLGVGTENFIITNKQATWNQLGDPDVLSHIKSFIWLSVKLAFDPPPTSFAITALEKMREEHVFRINVAGNRRDSG